jgi:hypothetical protein
MGYKDPTSDLWTLPIGQEKLWSTPALNLEDPHMHKILLSNHEEHNNAPACAAKVQEQPVSICHHVQRSQSVQINTTMTPGTCKGCAPWPPLTRSESTMFSYHRTTKTNAMKLIHQSLCNPPILLLIKAINLGFLKGSPHFTTKTVVGYLSPSPATSKSHMKRPCKGLCSTTPKQT